MPPMCLSGSVLIENDQVRKLDGTGKLWEDVFSDARLLFMPPTVCALLVLFGRNHNVRTVTLLLSSLVNTYMLQCIAEKLFEINEWGSYSDPVTLDESRKRSQDDEIYSRARLVNCGYFMQVILGDYVGAILGLNRDLLTWRLDPLSVRGCSTCVAQSCIDSTLFRQCAS